jgi:hypothetical protein
MTKKAPKQIDGILFSTKLLVAASVLIFIITGYSAVRFLYFNDTKVFWASIGNALASEGVTKTKDFTEAGVTRKEKATFTLSPLSSYGFTETRATTGEVNRSESVSSKVKDYARYTEISSQPGGPKLDLSSLINVWTDMSYAELPESKMLGDQLTNGQLVFIGNVPKVKRDVFVTMLRNKQVFIPRTDPVKTTLNGKKVHVFTVEVQVGVYNEALKEYLYLIGLPETAKQVGSGGDLTTNPTFELAVEPLTRTIAASGFPTINSSGADVYSQWGVKRDFVAPKSAISVEELQKRIQALAPPTIPPTTTDEATQQ